MARVREVVARESPPGIQQLLEDNVRFRNISADDYMAKLPSFLECADLVDIVHNQGFGNLITTVR